MMVYLSDMELKDFILVKKIGSGRNSTVFKALHVETGENTAIKVVDKNAKPSLIDREIYSNMKLYHRDIIRYDGWFEDDEKAYLLFEYAPIGDLWGHLQDSGKLREEDVKDILKPVIRAVSYIHSKQWIHRDIKPENILLFNGLQSKLGDLEFALNTNKHVPSLRAGTPEYMAPEILECDADKVAFLDLKGIPGYGLEIDCWSIGVLAYECLMNKTPFNGEMEEVLEDIRAYNIDFENISENAKDFLRGCLDINPETRIKSKDMLSHEWFMESKRCCFAQKRMKYF